MKLENCKCERIAYNLINDMENYDSHIQKLVDCCKIPLNLHWDEMYKDSCLFSISKPLVKEIEDNLKKCVISDVFNNILENNKVFLSKNITIQKEEGDKWKLINGEDIYIVKKEMEKLDIYKDSIGDALCLKTLINCLDVLYMESNEQELECAFHYHNKLSPLCIFREICDNHIKNIVNIHNENTLKKLKKIIREYANNDELPELNKKFINSIRDYNKDLNKHNHKRKVAIYHLTVLYIYASNYGPSRPKPPMDVRI
jgi:hypothetical protein